jgi:site-specific DNA recombinase
MQHSKPKPKRCAIYTRKSSEEGLQQEFNSLHAQRQACEAYVSSQAGEGWVVSKTLYDDGGISGGTMDRPGLKTLLADIEAGLIDIVVVYKVDRLTRALTDFAKIIDVLDQRGVSFVAVTQQFNTTSSMGRLTLNILLSFAQFEREVTGERIRDKIAASKRQGMWMGGFPPLGYDGHGRTLAINPAEAETVRTIFKLYNAIGTVYALKPELDRRGLTSKKRRRANGDPFGGVSLAKGSIYLILSNPVYIGKIRHRGLCHQGLHPPIIDQTLWQATQSLLERNRQGNKDRHKSSTTAPLLNRLFDAQGRRLVPTFAVKNSRRYRYYASHFLLAGKSERQEDGWRLPAPLLESTVISGVAHLMQDHVALATAWHHAKLPFELYQKMLPRLKQAAHQSPLDLVERVEVSDKGLTLTINSSQICEDGLLLKHLLPMEFNRRGREMRLVLSSEKKEIDATLLLAIAKGRQWFNELASDSTYGMAKIAEREGVSKGWVSRLSKLAFISPKIVQAIINGTQPVALTTKTLTSYDPFPLNWAEQEALVGI